MADNALGTAQHQHDLTTNQSQCETVCAEDDAQEDNDTTEQDDNMTEADMGETEGRQQEEEVGEEDDDADGVYSEEDEEEETDGSDGMLESEGEDQCPPNLRAEVEKFAQWFPGFSNHFRIIDKIGEGTSSALT